MLCSPVRELRKEERLPVSAQVGVELIRKVLLRRCDVDEKLARKAPILVQDRTMVELSEVVQLRRN